MSYSLENLSDYINVSVSRLREEKTKEVLLFFLLCTAINLIGGIDTSSRRLLYLDMLGTALAGIALGPWWGASVGLVTNLLLYFMLPESPSLLAFAVVNVLGGLYWGYTCNLKLLRPLEGIQSIQRIFHFREFKRALWFIFMSGGFILSLPVILILRYGLGYIKEGTGIERYAYYIIINMTDKLLCVVIATVIICSFFPALGAHLITEKSQASYGVSLRSILWFSGLYLVPCFIYLNVYPEQWYLWLLPYLLAIMAIFKTGKDPLYIKRVNINLSSITYGALFWMLLASVASFIEFVYFAINHVSSKYDIYHINGIIQYKNIIADAFSFSLVVALIGVVFAVLIQAVKQREDREIIRRVESAKDKIATDIHNDPLQLVSILLRKISTLENNIVKAKEIVDEIKNKSEYSEQLDNLDKKITDISKTVSNYYATYLPELDTSIRKIIKPLSNKDSTIVANVGFIQKIKDVLQDFINRNRNIIIKETIYITEKDLPKNRSDGDLWKSETIKILREVLNNAEKHSKATELNVELRIEDIKFKRKLVLILADNGIGFNPKVNNILPDSFGFYEIKTRAKDIGANINIDYLNTENTDNKGTKVIIEIPYDY